MATIVTRSGKGSPLTNAEVDANFTNLNNAKLEVGGGTVTGNLAVNGTYDAHTARFELGSNAETEGTWGVRLDGNYTDGKYSHRFRKQDLGGGVPLFIDRSESTANAWTPAVRFGTYTGNSNQLEVFGAASVQGTLSVNPYGTSSWIYMGDSDHGYRYIHNNSNQIGFLDSANGWGCYADDAGNWFSTDSVRAPIFYDSNDTAYYGDFASTSRINVINFNQLYSSGHSYEKIDFTNGNAHCLGSESYYNTYGPFSGGWNSGTVGHKFYSHNGTIIANIGTGGSSVNLTSRFYGRTDFDLGITAQTLDIGVSGDRTIQALSGDRAFGSYGDLHLNHFGGNVHAVQDKFTFNTSGTGQASGDWRAPIFYDSANTAFYWNPNDNNAHKFQTPSGYIHIGPMNTSHCHLQTDRSNFYFNTEIRVDTGLIGSYNEDLQLRRAVNDSHKITIGAGTTTVSQNTVVQGTVQHNGLVMTSGTNVDQLYTHTKSLTLTTSWQDTGVQAGMLPGGTYIVQVYASDSGVGGGQYYETHSGVMTWYSGDTNDTSWDEIPLHSAGHADSDRALYLRTLRTASADTRNMVLQIAGDGNNTAAYTYTFKFRRMI